MVRVAVVVAVLVTLVDYGESPLETACPHHVDKAWDFWTSVSTVQTFLAALSSS